MGNKQLLTKPAACNGCGAYEGGGASAKGPKGGGEGVEESGDGFLVIIMVSTQQFWLMR